MSVNQVHFYKGRVNTLEELRTFNIGSIAHALSQICRFAGNSSEFYSVAEHSVLVGEMVPQHRKMALLHDAHEAYCGDIIRPVMIHDDGGISNLLKNVQQKLLYALGGNKTVPLRVAEADDMMLIIEMWRLFPHFDQFSIPLFDANKDFYTTWYDNIKCLPPEEAEALFLERWEYVRQGNV